MLKKLMFALVLATSAMGTALAGVDVNKADQAALDGIKGLGPKTSKAILDERSSGGAFRDWADFEQRVKGISGKSAARLATNGLTVNGKPRADMPASSPASSPASAPKLAARQDKLQAKLTSPASSPASAPKLAASKDKLLAKLTTPASAPASATATAQK